jgi:hypothetical protein
VTLQGIRLVADYVLPLRWTGDRDLDELTGYLRWLRTRVDVIVVDGSPAAIFAGHGSRWRGLVKHLHPEPWPGGNGKVGGVLTGLRAAQHERVVIADDDVRYDNESLTRLVAALDEADLVRPQNYFRAAAGRRLPWHARLDTARTLLNRAFGSDYPGTFGLRRSIVLAAGGYDGDVLFENLELIRTIKAHGGTERRADDLFVARMPPAAAHFARQRIRQAYDDFAQPGRLAAELALLPLLAWAVRRPPRLAAALLVCGAVVGCALAERGRRRAGGTRVFGATSALWAPLWLIERAVCVWLAVVARLAGGIRYRGVKISRAATPQRILNARSLTARAAAAKEQGAASADRATTEMRMTT